MVNSVFYVALFFFTFCKGFTVTFILTHWSVVDCSTSAKNDPALALQTIFFHIFICFDKIQFILFFYLIFIYVEKKR